MAQESVVYQLAPYEVTLEPGTYAWCSCGLSKSQPFCDGSHRPTGFKPRIVKIDKKDTFYFCGCKQTSDPNGFCDGTHDKAESVQKYNKQLLQANSRLRNEANALKNDVTWAVSFGVIAVAFAAAIYFRSPR